MKHTVLITGANGQLGISIKDISLKKNEFNFIFKDASQLDITDLNVVSNFLKTIQCIGVLIVRHIQL